MKATPASVMFLLVTVGLFNYPTAFAQGPGPGVGRMYNPSTETTVKGTVEQVRNVTRGRGWGGTHLDLKSEPGTFDVRLGPSSFIASKGFTFSKGDQVEVTGSKLTLEGHNVIIAREVKTGGKVLTLRNALGVPEWSGGMRGGGQGMGRGRRGSGSGGPM